MACWTCRTCAGAKWPGLGYRFDGLGWCGAGGHEIRGELRYDPNGIGVKRYQAPAAAALPPPPAPD